MPGLPMYAAVPLQLSVDPVWFVAVAVVVFGVGAIVAPVVALSLRETRAPTPDERDRLARLEATDTASDRIRIVDGDGVEVSLRGPPGRRSLLVSTAVFDLDESTAAALLAAERARGRYLYIEYRALAAASVIGIATGMFGGLVTFSDGLFFIAVAALWLFWMGRRLQFAADNAAARRVGSETLAAAFETAAARRGVDPESATWRTYFEVQPPLGQRIDRLRDRS
ncbi:peptidase [Halohasta salina]|uniref:peptidase n=1 Tax=Halohasta salina TaxID=2961621 RepID=UPI0020A39B2D|nr:peptidase [Halohasta salina]